jgi:hypothetical protein
VSAAAGADEAEGAAELLAPLGADEDTAVVTAAEDALAALEVAGAEEAFAAGVVLADALPEWIAELLLEDPHAAVSASREVAATIARPGRPGL